MEFPSKPWVKVLDTPVPAWATHQIDFTNSGNDSYSVWIGVGYFQYFRGTDRGGVFDNPEPDDPSFTVKDWERELADTCSYVKTTDLQPIVENE